MEGSLAEVLGHLQRRQGVKKQSQHHDGLAGNESEKKILRNEKEGYLCLHDTASDSRNRLTYCWTQRNRGRRARRFEVSYVEVLRALPRKFALNIPMCACEPETIKTAYKKVKEKAARLDEKNKIPWLNHHPNEQAGHPHIGQACWRLSKHRSAESTNR